MPYTRARLLILAAAAAMFWAGASAAAQGVKIDLGLGVPAVPPPLVVVPGTSVSYAPDAPADVFFHKGRYYTVANGVWSTAPAYNGPWLVIQIGNVPPPVLSVPAEYYKIPPGHLKPKGPPPWAGHGHGPRPKKPKHK